MDDLMTEDEDAHASARDVTLNDTEQRTFIVSESEDESNQRLPRSSGFKFTSSKQSDVSKSSSECVVCSGDDNGRQANCAKRSKSGKKKIFSKRGKVLKTLDEVSPSVRHARQAEEIPCDQTDKVQNACLQIGRVLPKAGRGRPRGRPKSSTSVGKTVSVISCF